MVQQHKHHIHVHSKFHSCTITGSQKPEHGRVLKQYHRVQLKYYTTIDLC